jgi:hypothetical protein
VAAATAASRGQLRRRARGRTSRGAASADVEPQEQLAEGVVVRRRLGVEGRPAAIAASPPPHVHGRSPRNREEERRDRALGGIEARRGSPEPDEGLLDEVFREPTVAEQLDPEAVDARRIAVVELLERLGPISSGDELEEPRLLEGDPLPGEC